MVLGGLENVSKWGLKIDYIEIIVGTPYGLNEIRVPAMTCVKLPLETHTLG